MSLPIDNAVELNDLAKLLLQEFHRFVGMLEILSGSRCPISWHIFGIFSAKHKVRVSALVVRLMDKVLRQMNEDIGLSAQLN